MDKADLTPSVVACLVASQCPRWADLPVTPLEQDGWDNATYRLGSEMSVRLPSGEPYAAQVEKEHRWLPYLAGRLPLPIPRPLAKGEPGCGFPRPWSVYGWLPGEAVAADNVAQPVEFARCLAAFLKALYAVPPAAGPPPGPHNFFRGGSLRVYDHETRQAVDLIGDEVDAGAVLTVWESSLASSWGREPVWIHGDVTASNLLVVDGRLSGVIDFGTMAVGDPACDLTIAWTFFDGPDRHAFRRAVGLDDATWARARGWALWKALITHAEAIPEGPAATRVAGLRFGWRRNARAVIADVIADAH